jgi:molybdopterin converting factor small subunit
VLVRLGATLRPEAAPSRFRVLLEGDHTVASVVLALTSMYPQLATGLAQALPVVGGKQVAIAHTLEDGDEVALLLAVAGG